MFALLATTVPTLLQRGSFAKYPQDHEQTTLWYNLICHAEVRLPVPNVACSDNSLIFQR